ncbi:hypothetical protein [Candidatus Thiosymbion oneisti]|uniref:hypothetical protein n=1 Tax=Candidatus Thiosymbion oneisti TaxID=589554 RepID=UPI00105D8E19|nr:hypothetical protein [Candidatus Thiosymbion oneisti]
METAVIGAVISAAFAALGYILTTLGHILKSILESKRSRRAHLVELFSMLKAGKVAFIIQSKHRDSLLNLINIRDPELAKKAKNLGYDRVFSLAYPDMTPEEKELHVIIRAITEFTLRPLNESMLKWLQEDNYFKAQTWEHGLRANLAKNLFELEVHLLLWMAKYKVWIPDSPENTLVFLADEKKQGVGFPEDLQGLVERVLQNECFLWRLTPRRADPPAAVGIHREN